MGLNDIILNPTVLSHLFKDILLVESIDVKKPAAELIAGHPFLGKNEKKISLLFAFPEVVFLPDHHLQFIVKMLEACKLNLADVSILNLSTKALSPSAFLKQMEPGTVLLFGISPALFPLSQTLPFFEIGKIDGRSFLNVPSLDEINQDTETGKLLKSKLWICLKTIFGI